MDTGNRLTAVRGAGELGDRKKEIWRNIWIFLQLCVCVYVFLLCDIYVTKTQTQSGDSQREGRGGKWRWAKGRIMAMERNFALGNGHMLQYADDVQMSCTLETCMVLWTNITPIIQLKIYRVFTCNRMDGLRENYAKRNKSVRVRQIPYDFTYMWTLKKNINVQTKEI